jgi:hypothetical protein
MCWKHLNDTTPKARKEYSCHLCGLPIAVGTVHVARRGVYDGEAVTCRMHSDCETVTRDWSADDWETFEPSDFLVDKARYYARETP